MTSAAFASGQGVTRVPSSIEKVLLQEALRFDVVDPANDLVPADEEHLLYEGTWPLETDIKQGAGCPHQAPHMQFLGGGATFGREPEEMSEKVEPATLVRAPQKNILGCRPYTASEAVGMAGAVVVLDRGDCTFHHKALLVQQAGGSGMVVLSDHNTRPEEMTDYPGDQQVFIPMMLLAKKDGVTLAQMMSEMQHLTATITKGSHSTGPAEFRFSGIVAAPSPVGITLWRATRPVPGFVEPSAMTAALTSSCYLHTSKMRGAEVCVLLTPSPHPLSQTRKTKHTMHHADTTGHQRRGRQRSVAASARGVDRAARGLHGCGRRHPTPLRHHLRLVLFAPRDRG